MNCAKRRKMEAIFKIGETRKSACIERNKCLGRQRYACLLG